MATVDELNVKITANAQNFDRQIKAVKQQLGGLEKQTKTSSIAVGSAMGMMATQAITAIGRFVSSTIDGFANLEQNLGGAKAIWGDYSSFVTDRATSAADAIGVSTDAYLSYANKIGAIMKGTGMDTASALKMTTDLMQRSADQASVMGVTTATAFDAITAAAKGNFMLMDNIGVKMTQTNIEAYALENGLARVGQEMTEGQKVAAAYAMFMDRTAYSAGNFAREGATTVAGALATMRAQFDNLKAAVGQGFAPVIMSVSNIIRGYVIPAINACIPPIVAFIQVLGSALSAVFGFLGSIFGISGGTNAIADNTSTIASNVSDIGSSAGTAAKGIDGVAKSAKAAAKQLAGFDEMNVLHKKEVGGDSGSGGSAGGGGGVSIPTMDFGAIGETPTVFDSIGKSVEAFREKLRPLEPVIRGVVAALATFLAGLAFKKVVDVATAVIKTLTGGFGKLKAGILGVSLIVGGIVMIYEAIKNWDQLSPIVKVLSVALGALTIGLGAVSIAAGVFGVVSAPILLIIGAIAAAIALLVAGIVLLIQNWDAVWATISAGLGWINGNIIQPIIKFFEGLWSAIVSIVEKIWESIVAVLTPIVEFVKTVLIDPIITIISFVVEVVATIMQKIWEIIGKVIEIIITLVKVAWESIMSVLKPVGEWIYNNIIKPIADFFAGLWEGIKSVFGAVGDFFKGVFTTAWNNIVGVFNGIVTFFQGIWNKIKDIFGGIAQKIGETVSGAFKSVVNGILTIVENIFNAPIRLINGAIDVINVIPGVNIGKIGELKLPRMATGGIVSSPTRALIGEQGREAVLPLDTNTGWMDELAAKIGGGGQPRIIKWEVDGRTLAEIVVDHENEMSRLSGQSVVNI